MADKTGYSRYCVGCDETDYMKFPHTNVNLCRACHSSVLTHVEENKERQQGRWCIDHLKFFKGVIGGVIKLSNERDADMWASWKVGGQDFYIYGISQGDSSEQG